MSELIAGPSVFICNECVAVCNDVLEETERYEKVHGKKPREHTSDGPTPWPNMIRCALCRTEMNADVGVAVGENRGAVCADCVSAVAAARDRPVNGAGAGERVKGPVCRTSCRSSLRASKRGSLRS